MMKQGLIQIKLWLGALLLFPIILWLLPATFFDKGQSLCLSKAIFDVECFFCGMTRAVMHLHHLDLEEAIYYNLLVLLVYPVLVILWGYWVYQAYDKLKMN